MADLITIYTSTSIPEIYLVKSILEEEGIPTFIKDELTTQTGIYLTGISNGAQLQVMRCNVLNAVKLLQDKDYITPKILPKESLKQQIIIFIVVLVATTLLIFLCIKM